jgi:hypothetical protein
MTTLYLAWRQPERRWWSVGRLTRQGSEYVFQYTKGAVEAAEAGFRPLLSFPDLSTPYISSELFPLFANRVPPFSRPDYGDFVQWLDLEPEDRDPLVLLARSGGQRETDIFEVFPAPEPTADGKYQVAFFVRGLQFRPADVHAEAAWPRVTPCCWSPSLKTSMTRWPSASTAAVGLTSALSHDISRQTSTGFVKRALSCRRWFGW